MKNFFLLFALLIGVVALTLLILSGYARLHSRIAETPGSPVLLFASYKSGVNGTLLGFRVDGTFQYENVGFASSDVVTGRYTRTDSRVRRRAKEFGRSGQRVAWIRL